MLFQTKIILKNLGYENFSYSIKEMPFSIKILVNIFLEAVEHARAASGKVVGKVGCLHQKKFDGRLHFLFHYMMFPFQGPLRPFVKIPLEKFSESNYTISRFIVCVLKNSFMLWLLTGKFCPNFHQSHEVSFQDKGLLIRG